MELSKVTEKIAITPLPGYLLEANKAQAVETKTDEPSQPEIKTNEVEELVELLKSALNEKKSRFFKIWNASWDGLNKVVSVLFLLWASTGLYEKFTAPQKKDNPITINKELKEENKVLEERIKKLEEKINKKENK